jgi:hypothetical protein
MPKRIHPQDQWETDFQVPLPGEPRNIGPLETLFQRLLNRTERLKNRLGVILGLPWDATPPATIAGLAGRVSMLESNVSVEPVPNTIVLRGAQGAIRDGATHWIYKVVKANGVYEWSSGSKWVRIAQWTLSPTNYSYRGVFADLHFTQPGTLGLGSRVRVRAYTNASGTFVDPAISISQDYLGGNSPSGIITNAAIIQTAAHTVELWVHSPTRVVYVQGIIATSAESVTIPPYGIISDQPEPPSPISNGLYLEWLAATMNQTFVGPGYIVAASRRTDLGYIRYDNGIQVCWGIVNVDNGTWVFPAAFASPPRVQATPELAGPFPRVVVLYNVSMTQVGILRTDLSGNPVFGPVHLYAVGLWR